MFREEDYKYFKGNYKFAECLLKCRLASFKALCDCLPYFVPMNFQDVATNDTVICTLNHLTCMYKYRRELTWVSSMWNFFMLSKFYIKLVKCP